MAALPTVSSTAWRAAPPYGGANSIGAQAHSRSRVWMKCSALPLVCAVQGQMPQASAASQAREPIGDVPAAVVTHYAADAGPWCRKIRATIEALRCSAWAIWAPGQRSAEPAAPPRCTPSAVCEPVRSHTPTAPATEAGRSRWVSTRAMIWPRLRGIVRAFLWMFIRASFSAGVVVSQPPASQRRPGWTIS
jgi:hypothetical protein